MHQEAFGHFELQPSGRQPGIGKGTGDGRDEIGLPELDRRHVDRDVQLTPSGAICAGGPQHPGTERVDGARFLRERDDFGWRQHAADRVAPAQERFHPDQRTADAVDLRLVEELQSTMDQRRPQVGLGLAALPELPVHRGLVEAVLIASGALRPVERQVGLLQQPRRVVAVLGHHGDTDTDRHLRRRPIQVER